MNDKLIEAVIGIDIRTVLDMVKCVDSLDLETVEAAYDISRENCNKPLIKIIREAKKRIKESEIADSTDILIKAVIKEDIVAVRKILKSVNDLNLDEVELAFDIANDKHNTALFKMIDNAKKEIIRKREKKFNRKLEELELKFQAQIAEKMCEVRGDVKLMQAQVEKENRIMCENMEEISVNQKESVNQIKDGLDTLSKNMNRNSEQITEQSSIMLKVLQQNQQCS